MKNKIIFVVKKLNLRKYKFFRKIEQLYYFWNYYYFKFKKNKKRWLVCENIVESILEDFPLIDSGMVTKNDLRTVLCNLKEVLDQNVEWEIVELGCNVGTTSLFISKLLQIYWGQKEFHVYDSFEWLPSKWIEDFAQNKYFQKGVCKTYKEYFIFNFRVNWLQIPKIHVGWFAKIPHHEYPSKIAFAFFDGDFYSSITDSFNMTYNKLTKGARVLIHDYNNTALPWAKKWVTDFIENKIEAGTVEERENIGIVIKK